MKEKLYRVTSAQKMVEKKAGVLLNETSDKPYVPFSHVNIEKKRFT